MSNEIRIYVADLSAYNNGILHGVWIDAAHDLDEIWAQVRAMLAASPVPGAEEFAIHDCEGFGGVNVPEYQGLESVHQIAAFIQEHCDLGTAVLAHFCGDLEEATAALEENYRGEYASLAEYAQELTEQTTEIPQSLEYYIDYEAMGRDIELGGDIFTIRTNHDVVNVFWAH